MAASNDNSSAPSKKSNGHPVSVKPDIGTLDEDADQMANAWFTRPAKELYQKDAGLALSTITGFEERTCYRYAAGDRKTPGHFIRALLRSDHGEQWYAALMDGCQAAWWVNRQQRRGRIAASLKDIEGELA